MAAPLLHTELKGDGMGMSNQTEEKDLFHAVSLSGGKDSTAMLLLMVERGLPIHAVLTADTGMEFPEMYEHLQKLDDYLFAERGLHLTWLRHPKGFEWLMFEEKKQRSASIENRQRLGVSLYGNGWPGPRVRWCTGQLKTHLIHKEINRLKGQYRAVSYVGIAADEPKRIKSERYPLVDWGITEKEALQIFLRLSVDVNKVAVQLAAGQQVGIAYTAMLLEIAAMPLSPYPDICLFFFRQFQTRQVIVALQFVPQSVVFIKFVFFHIHILRSVTLNFLAFFYNHCIGKIFRNRMCE